MRRLSPPQGRLLYLLARQAGARRILEIGTLGGYSGIWLARALPAEGRLVTLELDPHHAEVARSNFRRAGVEQLVEIRVGPAKKGRCRVLVTDNGSGPENVEGGIQLFKSTNDPRTAGLGIGLMLSRQILQAHGCDISLERGRRGGAVVRFDLPVAER